MSTYILQKDLPGIIAGTEFKYSDGKFNNKWYWHFYNPSIMLKPDVVENNPEWFKLKELPPDNVAELAAINLLMSKGYSITSKGARMVFEHESVLGRLSEDYLTKHDKKWSNEDMRKCFKYAQSSLNMIDHNEGLVGFIPKQKTFEDFVKSLKK